MKTFNEDKLRFLGDIEDNYEYVVVNITDEEKEYKFIDNFNDAVDYYNKVDKGQYLNLYKVGYKCYNDMLKGKWFK